MNFELFFPVTLSGRWHNANDSFLDKNLKSWLLDPTSLTSRLKSNCHQFRVELLGQTLEHCHENEAVELIPVGEKVLVREVLLYCDNKPQVFARSLLPLSSLTGEEQVLADLGTQSLGQVIFNNPSLKRQTIEVAAFDENTGVSIFAKKLLARESFISPDKLWGRRSIFILAGKPLMVAEVFLPGAFAYNALDKGINNDAK